jgi:uncharacterized protein (DUF362 family)
MKVPHSLALTEVGVAKTALDSSCIINVPKLKVHHMAITTLCMKNLMGVILPKREKNSNINEKIIDLTSLLKDKVKINVVDGLFGAEFDETSGSPVEMDLIIAGGDMVAVDTVGTSIMGIDLGRVKYLKLAEERGLGVSNLKEIEVLGKKLKK